MNGSLARRAVAISCVVVAAFVLALPGRADEKTPKLKQFTAAVVTVDTKANTLLARKITLTTKVSRTFKVDEKTKFTAPDNKQIGLGDLKSGERVNVTFTEQGKELTAVEIALLPVPLKK